MFFFPPILGGRVKKRQDKEQFLPIMIYSLQYFVKEFNDLHSEVI